MKYNLCLNHLIKKMDVIWYDNQWIPFRHIQFDGGSKKVSMGCFSITIQNKNPNNYIPDTFYWITVHKYGDKLFKYDGIAYIATIHESDVIVVIFPYKPEAYAFTENKMYKLKLPDSYNWSRDIIAYDAVNRSTILIQKGICNIFSSELHTYSIYRGSSVVSSRYSVYFQNSGLYIYYTLNDFNGVPIDSYPLHLPHGALLNYY